MNEKLFYAEYFYEKGSDDTGVLEKNVNDYPFSSLANFLLLYHYKKTGHPGFEKLAKKTALLFSNTNWLQFQLSNTNAPQHFETINFNDEEKEEFSGNINEQIQEILPVDDFVQHERVHENADEAIYNDNFVQPVEDKKVNDTVNQEATSQEAVIETLDNSAEEIMTVNDETSSNKNEPLAFEPLHTVDYFASQGIKLTEEPISNDKLGNQMKSFTAWLKSMKKLHPSGLQEQSATNEKLVQASAEESNINTEVLTEAMAEVLIKQDKKEKAIEMFTKLSLINPSKSAYFASRIESIKSN